MTTTLKPRTLRTAALISGLAILGSVLLAPFAELYVFPKLIVPYNAAITAKNIIENQGLFTAAIFGYFFTFLLDVVLAWSLYLLLRPTHENLSLLTAIFRLVYSIIALVALNNLVTALRLITTPEYLTIFTKEQVNGEAMIYLRAFRNHWYFGLLFFGIHLIFLGYSVFKSEYIPKIFGIILTITGLGYLLTTLRPYLFSNVNVDFAQYTFYGELIFMLWLLIRGSKLKFMKTDSNLE
ncbi:MAG: hypothetical protein JWM28_3938 [Chitinophagaceae bacterium]|nr:hypothetical protein [Chitinophagaceae bacterium]